MPVHSTWSACQTRDVCEVIALSLFGHPVHLSTAGKAGIPLVIKEDEMKATNNRLVITVSRDGVILTAKQLVFNRLIIRGLQSIVM